MCATLVLTWMRSEVHFTLPPPCSPGRMDRAQLRRTGEEGPAGNESARRVRAQEGLENDCQVRGALKTRSTARLHRSTRRPPRSARRRDRSTVRPSRSVRRGDRSVRRRDRSTVRPSRSVRRGNRSVRRTDRSVRRLRISSAVVDRSRRESLFSRFSYRGSRRRVNRRCPRVGR